MRLLDLLQKRSQGFIIGLGLMLIVLIGVFDYLTGSELSFSIFYLIPIALLAWLCHDDRVGYLGSIAAAVIWLLVDLAGNRVYSSGTIPYWNAGVRLSFFLIVTVSLTSLRAARARQEELSHFLIHDLRSPLSNVLAGLTLVLDSPEDALPPEDRQLSEPEPGLVAPDDVAGQFAAGSGPIGERQAQGQYGGDRRAAVVRYGAGAGFGDGPARRGHGRCRDCPGCGT